MTIGQSQTGWGSVVGGAGGGGAQGGLAGNDSIGAGGGPGSSSAPGLTDATVTTASVDTDKVQSELGSVTIAPVS